MYNPLQHSIGPATKTHDTKTRGPHADAKQATRRGRAPTAAGPGTPTKVGRSLRLSRSNHPIIRGHSAPARPGRLALPRGSWAASTIRASRPGILNRGSGSGAAHPSPRRGKRTSQLRARSTTVGRRPGLRPAPSAGAALAGRQELLAPRQGALDFVGQVIPGRCLPAPTCLRADTHRQGLGQAGPGLVAGRTFGAPAGLPSEVSRIIKAWRVRFMKSSHDPGMPPWDHEPDSSGRSCERVFAAISRCGRTAREVRRKRRQRQLAATGRWFMESPHRRA
jgi:hypothetical protein